MAAATAKTVVLVTGANSGIGFELAAQLLAKGTYHVLLGSRSPEKGTSALKDLQSRNLPGSIEFLPLDVTDDDTIERAAETVESNHGKLDILVNNAGIVALTPPLRQQMRQAFDTNATGPAVVTSVFTPLLLKSTIPTPRIVNISSGAGSINRRLDPTGPMYKLQGLQYRASKTALSMVTACQFVEFGGKEGKIKVFAYCPGFTVSNLGPPNTAENGARAVGETVVSLMDVLEGRRDGEAGLFLHNEGVYPW